jgi:hypothetical protein
VRVRPHVCAAALACLSLLLVPFEGGAPARGGALLAGKLVHADARSAVPLPSVPPRAPVCTSANPHGDFGLVAVIARPSGTRPAITADAFRRLIAAADGLVYQQAEESGSPGAELVFACDPAGKVRVDEVTLPTALPATSFDSVVADLAALGYERPNEKYVVWLDGRPPDAPCGSADILSDQQPGDGNRVSVGPDWAVSFGCNSILHETMHVLGAVGFAAPHGTGFGHCWDAKSVSDVMCYDDGGRAGRRSSTACADRALHVDCGHDDYFAAGTVPASAYLATHWNVAGCYDRFLVVYGCAGTVAPQAVPPALAVVSKRRTAGGVRVTLRLSSRAAAPVSVAYTTANGTGRVGFAPGRLVATLDLRLARGRASQILFSDPRGLWLPGSLVPVP